MVHTPLEKGSHVLIWELGEEFGQGAPTPRSYLEHGKREPHPGRDLADSGSCFPACSRDSTLAQMCH